MPLRCAKYVQSVQVVVPASPQNLYGGDGINIEVAINTNENKSNTPQNISQFW